MMFMLRGVRARGGRRRSSSAAPRARRTMTGEPLPRALVRAGRAQPAPLRRLPGARRHRRAVPRAWRPRRRSSTSATCGCRPGRRSTSAATRSPTSAPRPARRRPRGHRCADLARRRAGRAQGRRALHPAPVAQLLLRPRTRRKGAIWRFFEGEATSEVDVRWGLRQGLLAGRAARPRPRSRADRARATGRFADAAGDVQAIVIAALAERYRRDPPPAAFRAIVSPLVAWIWIGGGHRGARRAGGAWPSPEARLRRVREPLRRAPRPRALAGLARWSTPSPCSSSRRWWRWWWCVPLRRRRGEAERRRGAHRGARGGQGGQVPRDPRRRARPPDGQALGGGLARAWTASCAPRRSRSCGSSTALEGRAPDGCR